MSATTARWKSIGDLDTSDQFRNTGTESDADSNNNNNNNNNNDHSHNTGRSQMLRQSYVNMRKSFRSAVSSNQPTKDQSSSSQVSTSLIGHISGGAAKLFRHAKKWHYSAASASTTGNNDPHLFETAYRSSMACRGGVIRRFDEDPQEPTRMISATMAPFDAASKDDYLCHLKSDQQRQTINTNNANSDSRSSGLSAGNNRSLRLPRPSWLLPASSSSSTGTADDEIAQRLARAKRRVLPSASYRAPNCERACDGLDLDQLEAIKRDNFRSTLQRNRKLAAADKGPTEDDEDKTAEQQCSCKRTDGLTTTDDEEDVDLQAGNGYSLIATNSITGLIGMPHNCSCTSVRCSPSTSSTGSGVARRRRAVDVSSEDQTGVNGADQVREDYCHCLEQQHLHDTCDKTIGSDCDDDDDEKSAAKRVDLDNVESAFDKRVPRLAACGVGRQLIERMMADNNKAGEDSGGGGGSPGDKKKQQQQQNGLFETASTATDFQPQLNENELKLKSKGETLERVCGELAVAGCSKGVASECTAKEQSDNESINKELLIGDGQVMAARCHGDRSSCIELESLFDGGRTDAIRATGSDRAATSSSGDESGKRAANKANGARSGSNTTEASNTGSERGCCLSQEERRERQLRRKREIMVTLRGPTGELWHEAVASAIAASDLPNCQQQQEREIAVASANDDYNNYNDQYDDCTYSSWLANDRYLQDRCSFERQLASSLAQDGYGAYGEHGPVMKINQDGKPGASSSNDRTASAMNANDCKQNKTKTSLLRRLKRLIAPAASISDQYDLDCKHNRGNRQDANRRREGDSGKRSESIYGTIGGASNRWKRYATVTSKSTQNLFQAPLKLRHLSTSRKSINLAGLQRGSEEEQDEDATHDEDEYYGHGVENEYEAMDNLRNRSSSLLNGFLTIGRRGAGTSNKQRKGAKSTRQVLALGGGQQHQQQDQLSQLFRVQEPVRPSAANHHNHHHQQHQSYPICHIYGSFDSLPSADSGLSCSNVQTTSSSSDETNYSQTGTSTGMLTASCKQAPLQQHSLLCTSLTAVSASALAAAAAAATGDAQKNHHNSNERNQSQNHYVRVPMTGAARVVGRARAKVDCNPCAYDKEALVFKSGDIIDILERDQSGTWIGRANGQIGHFKFINVSELSLCQSNGSPGGEQAATLNLYDDDGDDDDCCLDDDRQSCDGNAAAAATSATTGDRQVDISTTNKQAKVFVTKLEIKSPAIRADNNAQQQETRRSERRRQPRRRMCCTESKDCGDADEPQVCTGRRAVSVGPTIRSSLDCLTTESDAIKTVSSRQQQRQSGLDGSNESLMNSLEQLLFAIGLADEQVVAAVAVGETGITNEQLNKCAANESELDRGGKTAPAKASSSYLSILNRNGINTLDSFSALDNLKDFERFGIVDDEHQRRLLMAARIIKQASQAARLDFVENYRSFEDESQMFQVDAASNNNNYNQTKHETGDGPDRQDPDGKPLPPARNLQLAARPVGPIADATGRRSNGQKSNSINLNNEPHYVNLIDINRDKPVVEIGSSSGGGGGSSSCSSDPIDGAEPDKTNNRNNYNQCYGNCCSEDPRRSDQCDDKERYSLILGTPGGQSGSERQLRKQTETDDDKTYRHIRAVHEPHQPAVDRLSQGDSINQTTLSTDHYRTVATRSPSQTSSVQSLHLTTANADRHSTCAGKASPSTRRDHDDDSCDESNRISLRPPLAPTDNEPLGCGSTGGASGFQRGHSMRVSRRLRRPSRRRIQVSGAQHIQQQQHETSEDPQLCDDETGLILYSTGKTHNCHREAEQAAKTKLHPSSKSPIQNGSVLFSQARRSTASHRSYNKQLKQVSPPIPPTITEVPSVEGSTKASPTSTQLRNLRPELKADLARQFGHLGAYPTPSVDDLHMISPMATIRRSHASICAKSAYDLRLDLSHFFS